MGKLVVSEFVTLDGVMEDPGGAEATKGGGWAFQFERGPDGDRFKLEEVMEADTMLLGRTTYEGFAAAWPGRTDEAGFADKMNGMPKYVVSTTLRDPSWNNSTVIAGDVVSEISQLRQRDGYTLVAGSGILVHTLLENDLVDEIRLVVYPVVLGAGKKLFREGSAPKHFGLVDARSSVDVVLLTLQRDESQRSG
jgi:dihydrofolate reductase